MDTDDGIHIERDDPDREPGSEASTDPSAVPPDGELAGTDAGSPPPPPGDPVTPAWWEVRQAQPVRREWDPSTGTWKVPGDRPEGRSETEPPTPMRAGLIGGIIGAVLAAALVAALMTAVGRGPTVIEQRAPAGGGPTTGDRVVAIAEQAKPVVVHINTRVTQTGLFGTQEARGAGSGVILRSDGHILTNAHVVQGASAVEVVLASGEPLEGRIVGADLDTDVAVVKVDREDLPSAVIGTARDLRVGELAVAIGSPLGLSHSVTAGIVSALGRTTRSPTGTPLVDMIQTDASITRGNSGGALLDGDGALIGINQAIAVDRDVGAEGIGFAIPIDIARRVADELIATGRATHPYIGILGGTIDTETARQFNIRVGARISEVVRGGPADDAGLQPGDIIVSFGGEQVDSMEDLISLIAQRRVGDDVAVEFMRPTGQELQRSTVNLRIGDRPAGQ